VTALAEIPQIETIASEVITTFEIKAPPIPIESMLQHPKADMWEELNPNQLTSGFLVSKSPYARRMSLVRYLARHVMDSEWGKNRGLDQFIQTSENIREFARMLVMPLSMVKALSQDARTPAVMSHYFEVPEEDAEQRLIDIADYL
jgi:hypothetical protein